MISGSAILKDGHHGDKDDDDDRVLVIEKRLQLLQSNVIAVEVKGKLGTSVVVTIFGVDSDVPMISALVQPPANSFGWNRSTVAVTFTCSDKTSGIASCTSPVTVATEGANQRVTGTAVDNAGNSSSASVSINIDETQPVIHITTSPAPNAAGWNKTDVNVTFTCSDSLSGVASCPTATTVSTEGAGQDVSATAFDKAGNSATAHATLNIDKTAPALAITSPADGAILETSSVQVTGTASDALSGIASVTCNGITAVFDGASFNCSVPLSFGSNAITVSTTDVAGNIQSQSVSVSRVSPSLVSVAPNFAQQGQQSVTVSLTGQFTHFGQGLTTASFGSGINIVSLTVNSTTNATAVLDIDPTAITGTREVAVTTGNEIVTLANAFTIQAGTPTIVSVIPNSGQQGQQNLPVNLIGQFTNWVQGTSLANFGAGITVTSLTVNSPTSARAVLNIDPSATTGARDVTVTSGAETVVLTAGFSVTEAIPVLVSVNPASGLQGQQNILVSITGAFTHFSQGITTASFGPGISVGGGAEGDFGPVTVTSATTATAELQISSCVDIGSRTPIVTTGAEQLSLMNGFSVMATAGPAWLPISSTGANPLPAYSPGIYDSNSDRMILFGGTLNGTGQSNEVWVLTHPTCNHSSPTWIQLQPQGTPPSVRYLHSTAYDQQSNRLIVFGGSAILSGAGQLFNDIWILTNANGVGGVPTWTQLQPIGASPPGKRYIETAYDSANNRLIVFGGTGQPSDTPTNDLWVLTNANGLGGAPAWIQLTVSGAVPPPRGAYAAAYDSANARLIVFGGITSPAFVTPVVRNDTWILTNANGVDGDPRWIQLFSDGSLGLPPARFAAYGAYNSATNRLVVIDGLANCQDWGSCGLHPSDFANDVWILDGANGLGGSSTWVKLNPTGGPPTAEANWIYDAAHDRATKYGKDLWMLQDATELSLPVPSVISVSPNAASQGDSSLSITIKGANTHFVQGITHMLFGNGVTVGSLAVNDATTLTAQLAISPDASTGSRTLTVTTGTETIALADAFMVQGGVPRILVVDPSVAQPGQQNLSVAITGQFTHFQQGITTASFGANIAVLSVTVNSATNATAVVNIDPAATPGGRSLNLTTNSEIVTLSNAFTVAGPLSIVTSTLPDAIVGKPYSAALLASGGIAPYSWTLANNSSTLPPGLTMSSSGVISGTPSNLADLQMPFSARDFPIVALERSGSRSEEIRRGLDRFAGLPMSFESNQGQTNPEVKFLSRGKGYTLFLTGSEAVLALQHTNTNVPQAGKSETSKPDRASLTMPQATSSYAADQRDGVLRMRLIGADANARVVGLQELPGRSNYLLGNDPTKWVTAVQTFTRVKYDNIYPGIDLIYYGNQDQLEYDFVVAPGADPQSIHLKLAGAQTIEVDDQQLTVGIDNAKVHLRQPLIYQSNQNGERTTIHGRYVVTSDHDVTFDIARYDSTKPLIIDPVLSYSTYLGGARDDFAEALAVDPSGNAYVCGYTRSLDFPVVGAYQISSKTGVTGFISKLNPSGTALIYSTYIGGSAGDQCFGMATDNSGDAYVVGITNSSDFPTTPGAYQTTFLGNTANLFVAKIDPSGSSLVYSTYLGQGAGDANGICCFQTIALSSSRNVYLTGSIESPNFPTTPNALQTQYGGGPHDGYLTVLDSTGSKLIYSTFLGGNGNDGGQKVTVDDLGNAFITGFTGSSDFPITAGAFQTAYGGGINDVFVSEINPFGSGLSSLIYSTYLGGSGNDEAFTLVLDASGNAFIGGNTDSLNFPVTSGALQTTNHGGVDGFITKLNASASTLIYSTYLGGSDTDDVRVIGTDESGNAYLAYITTSKDFPVQNPIQSHNAGSRDGGLGILNSSGTGLLFSTYFGGSESDTAPGAVLDNSLNVFTSGWTSSDDFPITQGSFQTARKGGVDGFVAKFTNSATHDLTIQVTDAGSPQQLASKNLSIRVAEPLEVQTQSLHDGIVGTSYATTLTSFGGIGKPTWSVISGIIPPGLSLDPSGFIAGIPNTLGAFSFTVKVADVGSPQQEATADLSIRINQQAASLESASPSSGQQDQVIHLLIEGQFTHFVKGTTAASLGAGVSIGGSVAGTFGPVSVISPTSAIADIVIGSAALLGPRTLFVQTGSELVFLPQAFAIAASSSNPTLLSAAPNIGSQGQQALSVVISSRNTNFLQGSTQISFGAGITVISVTVSSPTNATAILDIDSAAASGPRDVIVTTNSEVATLTSGFAVVSSLPLITAVSPNSGPQGQSGPVGIAGQNTHFVQGTTQIDFGVGIAVSNISVTCPTCLTVQVQIAVDAVPGPRTVVVTTGSEVATLVNGFTVQPGTPILTSMSRAGGQQGQTFPTTITGQFTHFVQDATQVALGDGVTVSSINVSSPTNLTAQVTIDPAAAPGTRTLTVTTGSEVVSAENVFTVQQAPPLLVALNPGSGQQGQLSLSVSITGKFTHFVQGTSAADFGAGIVVSSVSVSSPTTANAVINIDPAAASGPRTITVTTNSEIASFPNGFTVLAGSPAIVLVNPNTTQQGQQNLSVAVTGQLTHFVQGVTQASFGSGVTIVSLTINSPTSATVLANIDPTATPGLRDVTLTTGSEVATLPGGFAINPGTPAILTATPNGGQQGQQNLSVTMTGQFTHWIQGVTTANFGPGITVVSLNVSSVTAATAVLSIDPSAATGTRDITLTTSTEVATLASGFDVSNGTPVLVSVNPNTGQQGQQNLQVTITGQFTHFVQGTTTMSFGAGITVTSLTVNSSTSATASVNIDLAAMLGPRNVTVTTSSETVTLKNAFTVTSAPPVLTLVNPNVGTQDQNLQVNITGQNTHFVQGATKVSFGSDIAVSSVLVSAPTALAVQLVISPTAMVGSRTVTVTTTGSEQVSLANGFTVQGTGIALTSVSPAVGLQSQALSVNIIGQGTHFEQGVTQFRFGPGVIVGNGIAGDFGPVTVTSPTSATAQLSIVGSALPASRTVTAHTDSELAFLANGFTVIGNPFLFSITPPSGQQGQTGPVTILGEFTNFVQGVTQAGFGNGISVGGAPAGGLGPVTVNSPVSVTANVTINPDATLGVRDVTVQTGNGQAIASVGFSVLGPVIGPAPIVTITTPTEAQEISSQTTVTGTVASPNLDKWVLEYQGPGSSVFTTFATGTAATVNGVFDPTILLNGNAVIRLTGIDTSGQTTSTSITVVVIKNLKVGNFTVSFNDLTVPAAGLPIQVVRTYDSRDKGLGDFGIGWRLDLKSVRTSTNVVLGSEWSGTKSNDIFPTYCIVPNIPHVVTVALSDGTTYEFQPNLSPQCQIIPPDQVTITFSPTGITPPNASLAILGNNQPLVTGSFPGAVDLVDLDNATNFDPDQYILTLPDGRTLQLSRQFGLQSMTDLNGNKLTVTPNGIMHSSGKSVVFQRDSLGRIAQITDPAGNILNYSYSAAGDLVSFSDQQSNVSAYTYNANHDLLTIQDPRGIQPIRNDYDASGRLVSHTDAFGNVINYTHNLDTRQEIVTDRLNNVTVNEYDADGNIVKVTDALGGVTQRTYDNHGNILSEINALNKTRTYTYDANNNRLTETDPLSKTTTYTYNSRNQVLTITDPLNRVTTNVYDASGNLASVTDPAGNVTSYTYNASGLRTSMTDPLNALTSYQYDSSGNLTQQTDPLGNITTYTYDGSGNRLTETRTRTTTAGPETLVTNYEYDQLNRLIQTTYPDGSTTQIQYNPIGKQSLTTDQLGRQTTYEYDLMGRVTRTTFPDNTSETSTYDAEGDRITSTDRAGRTTTFVYDALKRLVQAIYADVAVNSTTYDAIGQVIGVKDPRGNLTQYGYDDAGRRTSVTDALGHVTKFSYDAVGNQISMTDANSNATQYQYDNDNRRSKTIYPDSTTDLITYDAMGRIVTKTDQAGIPTQFHYDKLGRLVQVTDALGQPTKYTYDEVGNRLSQTDANNHTTTFIYDKLGRRIQRTLPLGMSETYTYDLAGNLSSRTDFNGKRTTYAYDPVNRLTSKTPDPSLSEPTISFTYAASGQRQTMVDASGTTTYTYDLRDRLTQKATPEGTLSYTYDVGGNITSVRSSNTNGTSVDYFYDVLNRLSSVRDNRSASGMTTYTYDSVGNLQSYLYPSGVETSYAYNTLNRLTNASISNGTPLAGYTYALGPAGNRTGVRELGGRQVSYNYDALYRLRSETISGSSISGTIGYVYDPVGNRVSSTSTVLPIPAATNAYDANDRLITDVYDANGNTVASGGNTYTYGFENHLTSFDQNSVSIVYDGDGSRVAKTVDGVITKYLLDDRNPTGYRQVLEEITSGNVQRVYTYGLNRISQSQASGTSFYGYDGHGNVRILTDGTGAVTDRYDYDAFGSSIQSTGGTPNSYLYTGEQSDTNLGLYFLRDRYYNATVGRFMTVDPKAPNSLVPLSLNAYGYAVDDPTDKSDPSGDESIADVIPSIAVNDLLLNIATNALPVRTALEAVKEKTRPACPQSSIAPFYLNTINFTPIIGRGPEGGQDCHVNAEAQGRMNWRTRFDGAEFNAVDDTGNEGTARLFLGLDEGSAAVILVQDLYSRSSTNINDRNKLYSGMLPLLVKALDALRTYEPNPR